MKFTETALTGAYVIELELVEDARGFFARTFCRREFEEHGLNPVFVQCNLSHNKRKGTLRGLHHQVEPHAEVKLVRCSRGAIFDVILDLRPDSATFKQWFSTELSMGNGKMLYVPKGVAHGFQTLTDDAEVFYQMSEFYHPESARGVRWNDPEFGIRWPLPHPLLSERDRSFSLWG